MYDEVLSFIFARFVKFGVRQMEPIKTSVNTERGMTTLSIKIFTCGMSNQNTRAGFAACNISTAQEPNTSLFRVLSIDNNKVSSDCKSHASHNSPRHT